MTKHKPSSRSKPALSPVRARPRTYLPASSHLSREAVIEIKQRLWDGETRAEVSKHLKLSIGLICNIGSGHRHATVPWPDGSTGPMKQSRLKAIIKARKAIQTRTAALVRTALGAL